jgi:hypothetical protein
MAACVPMTTLLKWTRLNAPLVCIFLTLPTLGTLFKVILSSLFAVMNIGVVSTSK